MSTISSDDMNAARKLIDDWCARYANGMPPVTARDKLVTDVLSLRESHPIEDGEGGCWCRASRQRR